MADTVLVAEDLFVWPAEQPQLKGTRCAECATLTFPKASGCPRCGSVEVVEALLPSHGTLWTWTSQEFMPKEPYLGAAHPEDFTPWYVGLVQLGDDIRVEGRLVDCDAETIEFGMSVRTVVVPFTRDADGNEILTFAFAPADPTESDTPQGKRQA